MAYSALILSITEEAITLHIFVPRDKVTPKSQVIPDLPYISIVMLTPQFEFTKGTGMVFSGKIGIKGIFVCILSIFKEH